MYYTEHGPSSRLLSVYNVAMYLVANWYGRGYEMALDECVWLRNVYKSTSIPTIFIFRIDL